MKELRRGHDACTAGLHQQLAHLQVRLQLCMILEGFVFGTGSEPTCMQNFEPPGFQLYEKALLACVDILQQNSWDGNVVMVKITGHAVFGIMYPAWSMTSCI